MRRVLFVTMALIILLGTFGTAFAAEPQQEVTPVAQLGEVWWFYGTGFLPGEAVDVYLHRPSTLAGWPFAGGPYWGTWWWTGPDSEQRRQSWPAWQFADSFGTYYAEFMLPRDEVWYPCSFPFKWNCNYVVYPGDPFNPPIIDWHSPAYQGNFEFGLIWPWWVWWMDPMDPMAWDLANPMDTVSPLHAIMVGETGYGFVFDIEVDGYYWKWSDLEDGWYPIP